jgi:choline dehydrogenase-like flavoprotein
VKFECAAMPPSIALTNIPWHSSHAYKTTLLKYKHMNGFVVIVRDKDPGVVYPDPVTGTPRIKYTVSELDLGHAWEGVCELAKVVFRSGASEVHLGMDGVKPFVRPGDGEDDDQAFRTWLSALRNKSPHPRYSLPFATAHQMGSCRMGTYPQSSVVDPHGKVWGVDGVYVCDASVFPSASGVNPMITNMAIADWISKGLVREIGEAGES